MVIAFQQVTTPQDRMIFEVLTGTMLEDRRPRGKGRYWCAADKPETYDDFHVAAVYRTQKVPEDAQCEECGIYIRELQDEMNDLVGK